MCSLVALYAGSTFPISVLLEVYDHFGVASACGRTLEQFLGCFTATSAENHRALEGLSVTKRLRKLRRRTSNPGFRHIVSASSPT